MGRRAKKAPVVTKKKVKLAKLFKCPFCANEATVECKMDFKAGLGSLNCRLCGASYQMPIHHLHEPVDVFSEWLDDCEAAQNPGGSAAARAAAGLGANSADAAAGGGGGSNSNNPRYDDDDDIDDDLPTGSGLDGRKKSATIMASSSKKSNNKNNSNQRSIDLGDEDSEDED